MNAAAGTPPGLSARASGLFGGGSWQQRIHRLWKNRLTPRDQVQLHQRNLYILPTGAGWMLGLTLLVMLIASINYQLNLGYLLTFMLAGNVVVGVYICHNNMKGLSLRLTPPARGHAGEGHLMEITLVNAASRERPAIGLSLWPVLAQSHGEEPWVYTDVPALGQSQVQLRFVPERRGWHDLPMLTARTLYPMGCFRVWTLWRPASRILVYPQPEFHAPAWPLSSMAGDEGEQGPSLQQGEFEGVRPYRQGDSMRWLVWRSVARSEHSAHWASRDQAQAHQAPLWLDWHAMGGVDTERRLSRLTAWVLRAEDTGQPYGLRLPGRDIPPALGPAHLQTCLEALALC